MLDWLVTKIVVAKASFSPGIEHAQVPFRKSPRECEMSTELPFWEGQIDALANTLWWTFDEKFGRMAHHSPSEDEPVLALLKGHVERVCLSIPWRVSIAFCIPYIAWLVTDVPHPWDQAWKCVLFVLVWPWIYHAFIYTKFLDPLRHLPGPNVFTTRNELILGTLVIWPRLRSSQ